jgi:uncharacterized repeat protein (TIGR03847 family)
VTATIDFGTAHLFTVGTSGPVGDRLFLLHITGPPGTLTVKVEKQQVAVLAGYLTRIVGELGRPGHLPENLDFDTGLAPEWAVGTIGVSYDAGAGRLVVVIEEATAAESDFDAEEGEPGLTGGGQDGAGARLALTAEQAAAFAIRATSLVEAGRPPCPLCGSPLDPSGHDCPRTNGHRPPVT